VRGARALKAAECSSTPSAAGCNLSIQRRMPNALVSLVLVVISAAAYRHFEQPPGPSPPPASTLGAEARRVQSIIDEKVRNASGTEAVRYLELVSTSGLPKCFERCSYWFKTKST
jgi:hypothetical protein